MTKTRSGLDALKKRVFAIHRIEPWLFPVLFLLYLALALFAELVENALDGGLYAFDTMILNALREPGNMMVPRGPPLLQETMRDFSALGGKVILMLVTGAAATYLFITRNRCKAWFLIAAVGSGAVLTQILKTSFARPRPEFLIEGAHVFTASLPSGHSTMAAVVYITLGLLMAEHLKDMRLKIFSVFFAVLLALLVGIGRVYIGAHWPSDVIAGWLCGLSWALLFLLIEKTLFLRRRVVKE